MRILLLCCNLFNFNSRYHIYHKFLTPCTVDPNYLFRIRIKHGMVPYLTVNVRSVSLHNFPYNNNCEGLINHQGTGTVPVLNFA
jgi:hypothetical protein